MISTQGYEEVLGINMGFFKTAALGNTDNADSAVITLNQILKNTIMEEVTNPQIPISMQTAMGVEDIQMELVEEKTTIIHGKKVPLFLYEGIDDQGNVIKQMNSGLFEGKKGAVMIIIIGEEQGWNQAEIDAFMESIR